jgi:uncharacterized protein (TIGR02246 family)
MPLRQASLVLAALLLASCASSKAPTRTVDVDAEVRQATQHYADLVAKMDNAGIAALFTDDGALVSGGKTIRGPKEIEKFLDTFKQYKVQSEAITVKSVTGKTNWAHVLGNYDQTVRLPDGSVVNASGGYSADWALGKDDVWRMRRMEAFPNKTAAD